MLSMLMVCSDPRGGVLLIVMASRASMVGLIVFVMACGHPKVGGLLVVAPCRYPRVCFDAYGLLHVGVCA